MWKTLWKRIVKRRRWESEMDVEMRCHIEERAAHLVKQGRSEESAMRQARVEFGGIEVHKELCRETSWPARTFDELRRNLHYSLRSLRKNPGFTVVGVLSLGLGIGANLATFSLVERLMLNPLQVRDPKGLYQVGHRSANGFENSQSFPGFEGIRKHRDLFSGALAWSMMQMDVQANGHSKPARIAVVSGSYFGELGIPPHIGRTLTEEDDRPGSANVVMLGYATWQRMFGGDPGALQQTIKINNRPFQVVGVAPPGFFGVELGDPPDVFYPLHGWMDNFNPRAMTGPGMMWLHTMVRLQPGVPVETASRVFGERALEAGKARRAELGRRDNPRPPSLEAAPYGYSETRNEFSKPLLILMGLVGLVVLIACSNLSTLLFVRGAGRAGEMSLRLALGASRGALVRQWMTECMLIAGTGGLLAVLLARWIVDLLLAFVGQGARQYLQFHTNWKIIAFAITLTLCTGVLFGLLPSLRSSNQTPGVGLKEAQPSVLGRRRNSGRYVLALQIAASLVLVTGASLFARTLWNLNASTGGYARSEVVWALFYRSQKPVTPEENREILERLSKSPSLSAVSMGRLPLSGGGWGWATVPGYTPAPDENNIVYIAAGEPGYLNALGIETIHGRLLEEKDRSWPVRALAVSESFAKHYFKDRNPVGAKVSVWVGQPPAEIVAVVRDAKYGRFRENTRDVVYYVPQPANSRAIVARPRPPANQATAISEIKAAVMASAKGAWVETGTLEELIQRSIRRDRLVGQLSAVLGLLGLIIAWVGIYGAMAYEVASRTREIGIRIALGAGSWNVMRSTLAEVGMVLGLGVLMGVPACLAGTRLIESLLFEVSATDPLTFAGAAGVLALSTLLAASAPARRATRLDPSRALRYE